MREEQSAREPMGFAFDRANIIGTGERLCVDELGVGPFADYGYGRAWMQSMCSRAIALTQRHPHFWRAVGLVAGALVREKTLDGSEVAELLRIAEGRHALRRNLACTGDTGRPPRRSLDHGVASVRTTQSTTR